MTTPNDPDPAKTPPPATAPCMILSADRDDTDPSGGIAFAVSGLPPAGNVTLQVIPPDPLLAPSFLWVPVKVAPSIYQIISYVTYGSAKQLALTGIVGSPVTVAPVDPTALSQLWELKVPVRRALDGDATGAQPTRPGFVLENIGASGAAIRRSTLYAVPGAGLQLGPSFENDPHLQPYCYEFATVVPPAPPAPSGAQSAGGDGSAAGSGTAGTVTAAGNGSKSPTVGAGAAKSSPDGTGASA
jgi:hypothetical protein